MFVVTLEVTLPTTAQVPVAAIAASLSASLGVDAGNAVMEVTQVASVSVLSELSCAGLKDKFLAAGASTVECNEARRRQLAAAAKTLIAKRVLTDETGEDLEVAGVTITSQEVTKMTAAREHCERVAHIERAT